jgi:hypothetical protein
VKPTSIACILLLAAALLGCSSGSRTDPIAVQSGSVQIRRSTVVHWERAIGLGVVPRSPAVSQESVHTRAISYLISSSWLIEEAARKRLTVTSKEARLRVEEGLGPISTALESKLATKGRTIADVEFEAKADLSASRLRKAILAQGGAVTEAEIQDYYMRHPKLFHTETRLVDLIENSQTRASALALGRRLGGGSRFARRALHETVQPMTRGEEEEHFNGHLVHEIFAAKPHIVGAPVPYVGKWVIFVVRRVLSARLPLAVVSGKIARRIRDEEAGRTLRSFMRSFQYQWRTRTHCQAGFVVPECSESTTHPEVAGLLLAG